MKTYPRKPPPPCAFVRTWLRARLGRNCLAPLTGTTSRTFSWYLHLLDAWMCGRGRHLEEAMRHALLVLQPSEWRLAAWAIVALGDWGFVNELWPRIKPPDAPFYLVDREAKDWDLVAIDAADAGVG